MLEGPGGDTYESCVRLIEAVDAPKSTEKNSRCLVSLTSLTTEDLAEAVHAIHLTRGPAAARRAQMPVGRSSQTHC